MIFFSYQFQLFLAKTFFSYYYSYLFFSYSYSYFQNATAAVAAPNMNHQKCAIQSTQ